jgi:hypothetical protein
MFYLRLIPTSAARNGWVDSCSIASNTAAGWSYPIVAKINL